MRKHPENPEAPEHAKVVESGTEKCSSVRGPAGEPEDGLPEGGGGGPGAGGSRAPLYHLVGAAGVGMSALAEILLAKGFRVTGSDRHLDSGLDLDVIRKLTARGASFFPQDGSGVRADTRAVAVSTAIETDNLDVQAAARLSVPVLHRADMLAELVAGRQLVAVTGTSGKSTVTGMVGWVLEKLGADPTVVNGAIVLGWRTGERLGSTRAGASDLWVIEADESDRTLLKFEPDWAIITNVSRDHFGYEETVALFRIFGGRVKRGLVSPFDEPTLLDGFAPRLGADDVRFQYRSVEFRVPLMGRHNAENALLAAILCERLGHPPEAIAGALASFPGLHRRLEFAGAANGVRVFDDYAHNPAKIRAAWESLAPGARRMIAVWRPHGYGPLANMMGDLAQVFGACCGAKHRLFLLPVYDAGGTANRSVSSGMLADRIRAGGGKASPVGDPAEAVEAVACEAQPGDVVLIMGARDPGLPALARAVVERIGRGS